MDIEWDITDLFGSEREAVEEKYDRYVKSILRRARKEATAAQEAAVAFDLLGDLNEALAVTKHAIAAEISLFVAEVNLRGKAVLDHV